MARWRRRRNKGGFPLSVASYSSGSFYWRVRLVVEMLRLVIEMLRLVIKMLRHGLLGVARGKGNDCSRRRWRI
jgi:hypothetical protein